MATMLSEHVLTIAIAVAQSQSPEMVSLDDQTIKMVFFAEFLSLKKDFENE